MSSPRPQLNIAIYQNLPNGGASVIEKELTTLIGKKNKVRMFSEKVHTRNLLEYMYKCIVTLPITHKLMARNINKSADLLLCHHTWLTKSPHLLRHIKIPIIYLCQEVMREYYDIQHIEKQTVKERIVNFIRLPIKLIDKKNITSSKDITIIANSMQSKRMIQKAYGIKPMVVYPGINTSIFERNLARKKICKKNQVISIGRITKLKRFHFLLTVIGRIKKSIRPSLVIIGESSDLKYISYLKKRALKEKVHLTILSNVSNNLKINKLQESRAFMFAPVNEPFGLVILEAMAVGLPLIAYRGGGGYAEIISNNNGAVINNLNVNDWARKTTELLEKPSSKYENYNRKYVQHNFSSELMYKKIGEVIAKHTKYAMS